MTAQVAGAAKYSIQFRLRLLPMRIMTAFRPSLLYPDLERPFADTLFGVLIHVLTQVKRGSCDLPQLWHQTLRSVISAEGNGEVLMARPPRPPTTTAINSAATIAVRFTLHSPGLFPCNSSRVFWSRTGSRRLFRYCF